MKKKDLGDKILKLLTFALVICSIFVAQTPLWANTLAEEAGSEYGVALSPDHRGGVVLVLSGGGTKGFAHIGVLKVLEQEGIPIVGIVGTSIGSVIGGLYATGYSADELYRLIMETEIMELLADSGTRIRPDSGNHRPSGELVSVYRKELDKKLKITGPLGMLPALSLITFLSKHTGHVQTNDFNYLPIPFACVATDLSTGEEVVLRDGNLSSAIRASISIPGLFEPWPLDGRVLVDGGLVANLPVAIARDIFPGYPIIAVNLAGQSINKDVDSFTGMVDVLMQTIDIMTIDRLKHNESLADLVLYPDVSKFSILDSGGYEKIYSAGELVANEHLAELRNVSAMAPAAPRERVAESRDRIVRRVRVEGVDPRTAKDIEKTLQGLVDKYYDIDEVNKMSVYLSRRESIATVDVDAYPIDWDSPDDIELVFSLEGRSPFEVALGGYTSNLHNHRWMGLFVNARDLISPDDAASLELRFGVDEWLTGLRYFTPQLDNKQWGFAFSARREEFTPHNYKQYDLDRYSLRAIHYWDSYTRRIGLGMAAEHSNAIAGDRDVWGPYLYFNADALDNLLMPSKGYLFNAQAWWNSDNIWVSRTHLTYYKPLMTRLHLVTELGLETGKKEHQAYRVLLGDREELYSRARHPLVGDQGLWAHVGIGRNFYNSWWGSIRGEIFGRYGMVMDDWSKTEDAWETGVAISVPGQFLNGKVLFIYDNDSEFTLGFTIGMPRLSESPLP